MTRENLCWYAESRFTWRGGKHAPWMKIYNYYKFIWKTLLVCIFKQGNFFHDLVHFFYDLKFRVMESKPGKNNEPIDWESLNYSFAN